MATSFFQNSRWLQLRFISATGSAISPFRTRKPTTPTEKSPVPLFELPPMKLVMRSASFASASSSFCDFEPSYHERFDVEPLVGSIFSFRP